MFTATKPFISTLGVGVFKVNKINGVMVTCVEVGSSVGVNVLVFCPARVGVTVKVNVGVIGVGVKTSVGTRVVVGATVGVTSVRKEQDESKILRIRIMDIFFI